MTIQSPLLVGGLAHEFYDFPLEIPSTQLTFTPSFFRGVGKKPPSSKSMSGENPWISNGQIQQLSSVILLIFP
jgi:hypothetical protein